MNVIEVSKVVRKAQSAVISHYAQKLHAQYILTLEALIKRYEAHLWLAYDDAYRQYGQSPHYEPKIVAALQEIGHGYIAVACALGYERALRDLVLTGFIKWYSQPVSAPYAAIEPCIEFNDKYLADSFGPALGDRSPVAMHPRLLLYGHYLWRAAEAAYKFALKQYVTQTGVRGVGPVKESMHEGGAGSGDYGHADVPGVRGGSAPGVVIRPAGQQAANDVPSSWTRAGHIYRGMTQDEYDATQRSGAIKSTGAYSHPSEGTNFADSADSAESYVNYGRDDPRTTGKPTYLVEIPAQYAQQAPDGSFKTQAPVDVSNITRTWEMSADRDGNLVAKQLQSSAFPGEQSPKNPNSYNFGHTNVEIALRHEDDYKSGSPAGTLIRTIKTDPAFRGEGEADRAMQQVTQWADSTKTILYAEPDPFDDRPMSLRQLRSWYRGLGFKDYAPGTMIRRPRGFGESLHEGGPGSGDPGHAGRPGERGGSAASGGVEKLPRISYHVALAQRGDSIQKDGLKQDSSGHTYVFDNLDSARWYADLTKDDPDARQMTIWEINTQGLYAIPDPEAEEYPQVAGTAWMTNEKIGPERIMGIRESLREQDESDDGDFAAVFAGPDDDETCDGCDDAVQGNPYTNDDVPEPGSFECMNRCRHFVQLSEDAPDDLAPYEWHGILGFGSVPGDYYDEVVRDQDLLPRWNIDGSRFHQAYDPSPDGIDLPHLDSILGHTGRAGGLRAPLPASGDILSDTLAPAITAASEGKTEGLAQWLWDTGLTPTVLAPYLERFGLHLAHLKHDYESLEDDNATNATVMMWLNRGEVDRLTNVMDDPRFLTIMSNIANRGLPATDTLQAALLSQVLGIPATLDDATKTWTFNVGHVGESVREGGAGSGYYGHPGRPGNVGGSTGSGAADERAAVISRLKLDPSQFHAHAVALEQTLDDRHKDDPTWQANIDAVKTAMSNYPMIHATNINNIPIIDKDGLRPAYELGKGLTFDKLTGLDRVVYMRMGQAGGGGRGAVGVMIDQNALDPNNFLVTKLGLMTLKIDTETELQTPGDHTAWLENQLAPFRESTIDYASLADVQSRLLVDGYERDHPGTTGTRVDPAAVVENDHGVMEVKYVGHVPATAIKAYFAGDQPIFDGKSASDLLREFVPADKIVTYHGEGLPALSHEYRRHYATAIREAMIREGGPGSGDPGHAGRPGEVGGSSGGDPSQLPVVKAGDKVSGLTVMSGVKNTDSISASLDEWKVLDGIREVPMNAFEDHASPPQFYSTAERERTEQLAAAIKASKEIAPLIVAYDKQGPYVLEGGHRYDALKLLHKTAMPAMVVLDTEVAQESVREGGPGSGDVGHPGRPGEVGGSGKTTADRLRDVAIIHQNAVHSPNDPATIKAYDAFKTQLLQQYNDLKAKGYKFIFTPNDPYPNSKTMWADVENTKSLKVYNEPNDLQTDHPLYAPAEDGQSYNTIFRGVHDVLGHAFPHNQFGPKGELGAYQAHSRMFTTDAIPALAAETLAQNAWVNYGPHNPESLPLKDRPFAPQKAYAFPLDTALEMATLHESDLPDTDYRRSRSELRESMIEDDHWVTIDGNRVLMHDPEGWTPSNPHWTEPMGPVRSIGQLRTVVSNLSEVFYGIHPTLTAKEMGASDMAGATSIDGKKITINSQYTDPTNKLGSAMTANVVEHEYTHAMFDEMARGRSAEGVRADNHDHGPMWQETYQLVHDANVAYHTPSLERDLVVQYYRQQYRNLKEKFGLGD